MSISSHLFGKQPIITFLLAVMMAAGFGYLTYSVDATDTTVEDSLERARAFYEHNPGVYVSPRDRGLLGAAFVDVVGEAHEKATADGRAPVFSERMKVRTQERFDGLAQVAFDARMKAFPAWKFGVSSQGTPPQNYLAYVFVHDSIMALGVSLVFFLLAGIGLEAAYGSLVFGLFCIFGALAPALACQTFGGVAVPLSGASGLVAAMLGAYFVRGLGGHFSIPGWLLLGVWAGVEALVVRGLWIDNVDTIPLVPHAVALGVGVMFAIAVRMTSLETTVVELADAGGSESKRHPSLDYAEVALTQGNPTAALTALREGYAAAPGNEEVALAFWDLAKEHGQAEDASGAIIPVIRDRVRKGKASEAIEYWNQLVLLVHDVEVEPTLTVRLGETLLDEGHPEAALDTLRRAVGSSHPLGTALAQRIVRVARDLDAELTQQVAAIALEDPELDAASRAELQTLAAEIHASTPRGMNEQTLVAPPPAAAPKSTHETTDYPIESDIDLDNTEDLMSEAAYEELSLGLAPDGSAVDADPESIDPNALSIQSLEREFAGALDIDGTGDVTETDAQDWNVPGRVGDLSAEPDVVAPALLDSDGPGAGAVDNSHLEAGGLTAEALERPAPTPAPAPAPAAPPEPAPAAAPVKLTLGTIGSRRDMTADETTEDLDLGLDLRTLKCVEGVPVGLKESAIEIEIDGRGASKVPYDRIDAVAVAAVAGISAKPVLVIDLVLNWMSGGDEPLKVIRLRSNRFNPVRLVDGAEKPVAALRALVSLVLEKGGGTGLPDSSIASGGGFSSFENLAAYERQVLNVRS